MHPSKFGDTYDIAKLSILGWILEDGQEWLTHPMYFPPQKEVRDETLPCWYADFLGVQLVSGEITQRRQLLRAVAEDPGHLFLDPDTGLKLGKARIRTHVSSDELIDIVHSDNHKDHLVLVYDQSMDRNAGPRRQQIKEKLRHLRAAEPAVHGAAYVSHTAFIWVSPDPKIVCDATRRVLQASHLPECCFVDDECGHIPHA